ncbi:dienelactone hydrolase family protein [Aspergillus avenaceus]|uniref:Dienelactone hydrolase family protein n=1 Tax=Aspergillus avenaceus TaxID=36643 RepID=A0A5N6TU60_ASPAV|nr:dienelactone hydrolase family protein [Aspergillus avenaceus]
MSISKACCSIPPVLAKGYQPKGEYITLNGLKTYVVGPEFATDAILLVYDIFGFFPQTLQGADILATSSPIRQYRVFMPDFFEGSPADISWYPPTTETHQEKLNTFFQTKAGPLNTLSKIPGVISDANKSASNGKGFAKWAIVGHCWGGKIASLSAGQGNTTFQAAVQCHPAMVDPAEAKNVNVPMAMLASKDEPSEDVEAYRSGLQVPHHFETFSTQIHGWMAARSDLEDELVRKEYERGYAVVLSFLEQYF